MLAKTLNEQLKHLKDLEQEIRDTVEEVKNEAKNEAMKKVHQLLLNESGEEAKRLIDEIEELKALTLTINTKEVNDFVDRMLNADLEEKRFSNKNSGTQFHFEKPEVRKDVKELMQRKGYQFVDMVEGKSKFEKGGEFYYALEFESGTETSQIENSLKESAKFCNLVVITNTESAKNQLKDRIENWLNKTEDNEVLKKYLTIQLGSHEQLSERGTSLERMKLA